MLKKSGKRNFTIKVIVITVLLANLAMASLFVFHEVLDFTSSNSAIYILRGKTGGIDVTRDLLFEDANRLMFMFDANCIFSYFMKGLAIAKQDPVLETTWDPAAGDGLIKEFKNDGTIISLAFSRFLEDSGKPQGLFLGGDLPYGDISRSKDQDTSGFGFYDGEHWHHIWCAANEGFNLSGTDFTVVPPLWNYVGSKVLKNTQEEVILESDHDIELEGKKIKMKRLVDFKSGSDYFLLKIRFTNASVTPITYGFAYGDEPWVGHFGGSEGDVGWYSDGVVKSEKFISPVKYNYAGFWDRGNDAAFERGDYSGYANFIQWENLLPSTVFFSNDFNKCCDEEIPLYSKYNRIINLVWLNQILMPGESKEHVLAVGMAKVDPEKGLPVKPVVELN